MNLVTTPEAIPVAVGQAVPASSSSIPPILLQYWRIALRWRWLIAAIMVVALAVGAVVSLLQVPLYASQSEIMISRQQKNVTNVEGLEKDDEAYYDEFYDTQYALLRTRSLAKRIAKNLNLAHDEQFFAAHGVELPNSATLSRAEIDDREETAAGLLLGGISINPVRDSSLVDIVYTSRDPAVSTRIANAWPQEFIGLTIDRQFASSADARKYLEDWLDQLRTRLERSEDNLINFGRSNNIVKLGASRDANGRTEEPRTLVAGNLETLNAAYQLARTDRVTAEARARTASGDNSPEVLNNGTIASLRSREAELSAEYTRILTQFQPGYPPAMALKNEIDSLKQAIVSETRRVSGGRQVAYEEAVRRENQLAAQVRNLQKDFDLEQRNTIQYNIYQREVDTNRQLYDALLQRYKEIGVAGTVGATNVVVVDPARAPGGPTSPNLMYNLILTLVAGAGISTLVIIGIEQIDESIRDPRDIEHELGLPLLGYVPMVKEGIMEAINDPRSHAFEAYVSVHTALAFATTHGLPKSFLVTSADSGEGKSTTALALAKVICRTGKTVLLIDADMRSPSMHEAFDFDNTAGFSNVLTGEEIKPGFIHDTELPGLSVMPCGPRPPNPAELLSSERLKAVLDALSRRFDHIVVDAPPVMGLADAPLLGAAVEGNVLVIQAERASIRALKNTIARLAASHNRNFGAVLTKVNYQRSRHNFGYGYGYGYG